MTDTAVVYVPALDPEQRGSHGGLFRKLLGIAPFERNLMALKRAGIATAYLAGCDEARDIAVRLAARGDSRLPSIRHDAGVEPSSRLLLLDGRRLFHPDLVREAAEGPTDVFYVDGSGEPLAALAADGLPPAATSLAGALAVRGLFVARPLGPGHWAQAVSTEAERRLAARLLLASLVKPTDGWVSRRLNRPLSTRISAVLARRSVSPDLVTLLTLLVAVLSAVASAWGVYAGFALGGVLFQLASVLDGVDGEVARLTFRGSVRGEWLDTVCDDLANIVYFAGLTVGVSVAWKAPLLTWLGIITVVLDVVTVSLLYWLLAARLGARSLLAFESRLKAATPATGWKAAVARLQPIAKRDTYALLIMLAALAGIPWVVLLVAPVVVLSALVMAVGMAVRLRHGGRL